MKKPRNRGFFILYFFEKHSLSNMKNILEIIERKKQGIDCTEEESAEIKGWIKETIIVPQDKSVQLIEDIQEHFPIEYGEAIDEIDGTKFARKCSFTGKGMDSGFVIGDGDYYASTEALALEQVKKDGYHSLKDAFNNDYCYYTEWNDESEYQYVIKNGILEEIEE